MQENESLQLKLPNISQRILSVMSELSTIHKGDAKVNGQYRFVSHDQVTSKIHPLIVKYGIVIIPTVKDIKQEGNRTQVSLNVAFINADVPSEYINVEFPGYGIDNGDKGPGKAISYAFKYALLKTFCLETCDDPDNDANAAYEPAKCLEFDSEIAFYIEEKDEAKLKKFIEYSASLMGKHTEDVKREALKKMTDFIAAFKKWNPKK